MADGGAAERGTLMTLFITGATGFIGRTLLARLAYRADVDRIYLLIRDSKDTAADERARRLCQQLFPPAWVEQVSRKIVAVAGEVTRERLGLDAGTYDRLTAEVDHVVHAAASTKFAAPLDQLRMDNVESTREVLAFATRCQALGKLRRFDYVSTAFVAGINSGVVSERDLDRGQQFANHYEQTKFEAEALVASHRPTMPIAIYRPSVVVGDSRTGFTPHFRVLYWPLRLLTSKVVPIIPVNSKTAIDVVPVDYVAGAMDALMFDDATIGGTFHLTAGRGNETNIRALIGDAIQFFHLRWRPIIPFTVFDVIYNTVLRNFLSTEFREKAERARPYRPYLEGHGTWFDSTATRAWLEAKGVPCPKWDTYKMKILEYVKATEWGTVVAQPEHLYYPVASTPARITHG